MALTVGIHALDLREVRGHHFARRDLLALDPRRELDGGEIAQLAVAALRLQSGGRSSVRHQYRSQRTAHRHSADCLAKRTAADRGVVHGVHVVRGIGHKALSDYGDDGDNGVHNEGTELTKTNGEFMWAVATGTAG